MLVGWEAPIVWEGAQQKRIPGKCQTKPPPTLAWVSWVYAMSRGIHECTFALASWRSQAQSSTPSSQEEWHWREFPRPPNSTPHFTHEEAGWAGRGLCKLKWQVSNRQAWNSQSIPHSVSVRHTELPCSQLTAGHSLCTRHWGGGNEHPACGRMHPAGQHPTCEGAWAPRGQGHFLDACPGLR